MGIFATRVRRGAPVRRGRGIGVPRRFEAVGEAMAGERDVEVACSVVGRDLARDGADLGEALDGLHATASQVTGREPGFAATRALCRAWAEETLSFLHQISCENPMTGLASLAHLRARLTETYRGATGLLGVDTSHALVVIDLASDPAADRFNRALRLVRLGETVRLVFPGSGTLCQAGPQRLVLLTRRTSDLGLRVANMRGLVDDLERGNGEARVWIEGLPPTSDTAGRLLDELAR